MTSQHRKAVVEIAAHGDEGDISALRGDRIKQTPETPQLSVGEVACAKMMERLVHPTSMRLIEASDCTRVERGEVEAFAMPFDDNVAARQLPLRLAHWRRADAERLRQRCDVDPMGWTIVALHDPAKYGGIGFGIG